MILEPLILFPRSEVEKIIDLRSRGFGYEQIGLVIGRHQSTCARYHRIYLKFGPEAFANG